MKSKIYILVIMCCAFVSCNMDVKDNVNMVSPSIEISKKDGFFMNEYIIEQYPKGMLKFRKCGKKDYGITNEFFF